MAGEMFEATREEWPDHYAIADAVGGTVQPFDYYQGPYILIGSDIRIGNAPYQYSPVGLGVIRLWLTSDDGIGCQVYREDTDTLSEPIPMFMQEYIVAAALELMEV